MVRYFNSPFVKPNLIPTYSSIPRNEPPYLKINNLKIYPNSDNFLSSINIKVNKRGGDTSKLKFSAQSIPSKIGDRVQLFVNDQLQYTGFVDQQKFTNNLFEITVIPEWAKLGYSIVSGGIVVEETITIVDLVNSLFPYIIEQGIGIGYKAITIPKEYTITTSTMGKTILELLDECEQALPAGFVWGVVKNYFFFFQQSEIPTNLLNWRLGDFSDSQVNEDFGNIYTQTSVFMKEKDEEGNEQNRSLGIVGAGGDYPKIPFYDLIGVKMNKLELPNIGSTIKSLEYAYNLLQNQFLPIDISIKDLNFQQKLPKILTPYSIYTKPQPLLSERFVKGKKLIVNDQYNSVGGYIQTVDTPVEYNEGFDDFYIFDLSKDTSYLNFCDGSESVQELYIEYYSTEQLVIFQVTDGTNTIECMGSFGVAKINLSSYNINKRKLQIECLTKANNFNYNFVNVTFVNAQKVYSANIREILFKMDNKFNFSVDLKIANINTVLSGYLFKENKKLERLEEILSLSEVE